jgi:hypothetical protein
MTPKELEAAIQVANQIFSRGYRPENSDPAEPKVKVVSDKEPKSHDSIEPSCWPLESFEMEQRFREAHARLFPFIGRKVRTPEGPGTLLQVFAERVTVLLDSERDKCSFFTPTQIEPVSTE